MRKIAAVFLILFGIYLLAYPAFYYLLIGGLVQLAAAPMLTDTNASFIQSTAGATKIVYSIFITWFAISVLIKPGYYLFKDQANDASQ
jgi:uncharacterized membrane protein YtjA (UPF0391 family)